MLTRRQFIKLCASTVFTVGISQLGFQMPSSTGTANLNIPVLVYHRVGTTNGHLTVSLGQFTQDLKNLKRAGFVAITLKHFNDFIYDRNINLPQKPVLITFDDGYYDNYANAFPLLKEHGMVAAFYIISGLLGAPERLTKENIREMSAEGMSIGSHTVTHRPLGELSYEDNLRECTVSKKVLEDVLGSPVVSLAYPRGSYNHDTVEAVQEAGYITAFTVISGKCERYDNALVLRRIPLFSYDHNIMYVMEHRG